MSSKAVRKFFTVALGAADGGMAALKTFVNALPDNCEMAFFIVHHTDPDQGSLLASILGPECSLPVKTAEQGCVTQPNTVYVLPPKTHLELDKGVIKLSEPVEPRGLHQTIDHLFKSLARDCGARCAAIVLSGCGSDGAAGVRAVKASGGLVLVQSPDEAEHDSMPLSALETRTVDKSLPVSRMYDLLSRYAGHAALLETEGAHDGSAPGVAGDDGLKEAASILQNYEQFNLNQYKPATARRRMARRMRLTEKDSLETYLQLLEDSSAERRQLTKELLIGITDFFRDPEAYAVLEKSVVPDILDKVQAGEEIRIWVAGCASGEEAYSIAIVFMEALAQRKMANELKIFATDIDEQAIKTARRGLYPGSITAALPDHYLSTYFDSAEKNDHYRIKTRVRERVSFALQNVISDPPFNHLHLISCRNLLIYFNKEVQEKILASFYFALEDYSYLFLGSSESLGSRARLFRTRDKKWRVFEKLPGGNAHDGVVPRTSGHRTSPRGSTGTGAGDPSRPAVSRRIDTIRQAILDTQVPATIVVSQEGAVLYNHGYLDPFCAIPDGEPRNDIMQMIRPALRSRVRSAFYSVKKSQQPLTWHCTLPDTDSNETKSLVRVRIVPVPEQSFTDGTAYTISFQQEEPPIRPGPGDLTLDEERKAARELEQELAETKEELRHTIEELETSTEELKASHEEALSTNEELQSSNEELEASSEELRSLNEELSMVNSQLKDKIEQLQRARDDVQNFFSSTDIPTLFLDVDLFVRQYTPAAEVLLKMGPGDVNRHINSLARELIDEELIKDCEDVLRSFKPARKEVRDYQGRWFSRQVTPYRTEDRRVCGVVLVFQDVTTLKTLSQRAESREAQQAVVARLGMLALSGCEPEEIMQQAVRQVAHVLDAEYCKVLRYQPEKGNLLLVAGVGWHSNVIIGQATVPDDTGSQAGYTLRAREPVIVDDLHREKRFSGPSLLIDHGVTSGISCLINHSNPPYGVLGVHTKAARRFSEDDGNFLQSVANMLSTAIHAKAAQEMISSSEERLDMARGAANIGIHDFDVLNNSIYWDENHRKMWGVPLDLEPITFEVFESALHPDDKPRVTREIAAALQKPGTYEWLFRVVAQHDRSIRNIVGKGHVIHRSGQAVRIVGTVQDITDRVHLEHSLQRAINDLREIDQRKNQFLSILGHELRNPLAAIANGVEIVEQQLSGPDRVVNVMKHSVDTMRRLLDDLLDLNRVSENRIDLNLVDVNLAKVLERVVEQAQMHCKKKGQRLRTQIMPRLWVNGDATRLEQIFVNLVFNACKFTPAGGEIVIKADLLDNTIKVSISDTGIGLQASELEKVFEPFFQIKPKTEAVQGLGIGLALAKNLVELQQGSISAASPGPGEGSTFSVVFPAQRVQYGTSGVAEGDTTPGQQSGQKVLFVDDNESMLMIMPMLLESLNCEVVTARTGEEGIEKAKVFQPDVIILDIGLPGQSGHEVARTLRSKGYEGLIVALSGYSHKEIRDRSREMGIDHHLAKPSTLKEISDVLTAGRLRES